MRTKTKTFIAARCTQCPFITKTRVYDMAHKHNRDTGHIVEVDALLTYAVGEVARTRQYDEVRENG